MPDSQPTTITWTQAESSTPQLSPPEPMMTGCRHWKMSEMLEFLSAVVMDLSPSVWVNRLSFVDVSGRFQVALLD